MTTSKDIDSAIAMHLSGALFSIEKPTPHNRGKVRDLYDMGDVLCMINTDRVSAFDQVLGTIPLKGALLCEQAEFWFKCIENICPHHFIERPDPQIMMCKKAEPLLVEVIVRGFLAGSLMRENRFTKGKAYGLSLDPDLKDYSQFKTPILTPTTKANIGSHDEPISASDIVCRNLTTKKQWEEIEEYALALFEEGSIRALNHGLLLVDTKYEFGLIDNKIHLIDEIHTSDSSRFFIESDYHKKYQNDKEPVMLDKEYLRQQLIKTGIDPKNPNLEGITLDDEIRMEVARRYFTLTEKITGKDFIPPKINAYSRVHEKVASFIC